LVSRRDAFKGAAAGAVAAGLGVLASPEAVAQETYDAIIEHGTFWITPETLGAPTAPGNAVKGWATSKNLRVQYWPRPDHTLGLLDLLANRYREENPYGLHNYRIFRQAHILTASGVGGGR
jgi:hypothetical protein